MAKIVAQGLPKTMAEFRKIVEKARSTEARAKLVSTCEKECKRDGGRLLKDGANGSRAALRLYESRLMEIVESPHERPDSAAWRALMYARSDRFARWLQRRATKKLDAETAEYLAWSGADRAIPLLEKLLKKSDRRIISAVATGAGRAVFQQRASARFRDRMFRALMPIVDGSQNLGASESASDAVIEASEALLTIDKERAAAHMCSPACVRSGNRHLRVVLIHLQSYRDEAPAKAAPRIDPDLLWPIYDAARKKGRSQHQLAGLILGFTADVDPIRTRRECREAIKVVGKEWSPLKDEANAALRRCKRVPEPAPALEWLQKHPGKLPAEAASVLRAYELADHVLNDGFPLYFHNCGRHWKEALAGLQAMKLSAAARVLQDGARIFGPKGPPLNGQEYAAAVLSLNGKQQTKLEALGDAFEEAASSVMTCVERYMAKNAAAFARAFK